MFDTISQFRYSQLVCGLLLAVFVGLQSDLTAAALPHGFIDESVSTGWNQPTGFTFDADGRQFAWEKAGRVYIVGQNGTRQLLLDISQEVGNWRDYGLIGLALDPAFLQNGRFYLSYVVDRHHLLHYGTSSYSPTQNEYFAATIGRITRYQADPATGFTTVVPGSRTVLVGESKSTGIPILHTSHGVGSLIFGDDGTLLASAGDGASYVFVDNGSAGDTYSDQALADGIITQKEKVGAFRSQLIDSHSGKILRIDPETGDGLPSNPFYDASATRAPRSRVWTLGVRNAYRLAHKPGSGSADPADGNPGTLIFGDVGWTWWEEFNVVKSGGANCGWPLFEGLNAHAGYTAARTFNLDAPNPLAGIPGCVETHFAFQDLIKQAQKDHAPAFPNPCDPTQSVPTEIPHFMHHRPVVEWSHKGQIANVPIYDGNSASTVRIDDPESPVDGPTFRGNASTSGFWHPGTGVPEYYADSYFHADYVYQWIRLFRFDEIGDLKSEEWFTTLPGRVTCLGMNPVDGSIHYINYDTQELRRIGYYGNVNRTPIAEASADKYHGPTPLTVQFDASESSDPDGDAITYAWDFGDGTTSSEKNPVKVFTTSSGMPARRDVTLTVTDSEGATRSTSLIVSTDNSPPAAHITSPVNGARFNMGMQSTAYLAAHVSDREQPDSTLAYRWEVTLHHDDHIHPEPAITTPEAEIVLTATPAGAEFYAYEINLTVTDDQGLSTSTATWLYPNDAGVSTALTSPNTGQIFAASTPITLEVTPPAGATRVIFRANGVPVAVDTNAPFSADWTPAEEGEYSVVAHIHSAGVGTTSLASSILVSDAPPSTVPAPWKAVHIGNDPVFGHTAERDGVFTMQASGGDTWSDTDNLHFTYRKLAGDCQITARILDQTNTHPWAKAGLMFRSNNSHDSAHAFIAATPEKGVALYTRSAPSAETVAAVRPGFSTPRWLRLVRTGNKITAFHSEFGITWAPVKSVTIPLGDTIEVGMAIASVAEGIRGAAIFDKVSTQFGNIGTTWQNEDLTVADPGQPSSFQNGTGSFVQTGADSYTVTGAGSDVFGASDEFNFVRQSLTGDGQITAKVAAIDATHPWAKAGVMVRSSSAPDAAHAFMSITPERGASYVFRPTDGAPSTNRRHPLPTAPHWVRIIRTGNLLSGFHSTDGTGWVLVSTETISLENDVQVGLAVTSHQAGIPATAEFQNVTITGFGAGNGNLPPQVAVASPTDGATVETGQNVDLSAWVADSDGSVVSVGFYANGNLITQLDSTPWIIGTVFPFAGDYQIVAAAVDDEGAVTFSAPATLHVAGVAGPPPAPWTLSDIGNVASTGSATATGSYITLQGTGEDIFGTQDSFHYLHQQIDGDVEIVAKVAGISADADWAKTGLMIRQSLAPSSPHATVALTPTKGALFLSRASSAASTTIKRHPLANPPRWIKITRQGNLFTASHSADGQAWIQISQATVPIFQQALVGLAFTSRTNQAQAAVTFESVTITP